MAHPLPQPQILTTRARGRVRRAGDRLTARPVALLMLPTFLALAAVSLYPMARGFWLATRNTSLALQQDAYVGLDNFTRLRSDGQFWNAWRQTLWFTGWSTVLETLIGLGMALVLARAFRGRGIVRAAMLVPWAIPTVVSSRMFGWLFDGQTGVINYVLHKLGLIGQNINWTGSVEHAMQTVIICDVWKTTPFMALLLLAGLQTIPRQLEEAARVDGASAFQVFLRIRLPLLMPTLLIAALLRALDAFRVFDIVYVLTGGGPADSTETLSTFIYKRMFSGLELGYGSALSVVMFATEAAIALTFAVYLTRRLRMVS
jgi:multiple sugar transport system permease protein